MEWQTTAAPMDRPIEVETTARQIRRGQLVSAGTWKMSGTRHVNAAPGRDQFTMKDEQFEQFEVHRWRELEAE